MADENAPQPLPAHVRVLWGLDDAPRRGPRPTMTRGRIVAAAIDIADAEGLAAVTMARVAQQVGSSPMGLYRYVANKDALLLLMSDAAVGTPPELPPSPSWRTGLEHWARAVRGTWMARPWLLQIPVSGPPAGPNNMAWLDAGLRALAGTPVPAAERLEIMMVLTTYLRGEAWLSLDLAAASSSDPDTYGLDYGGAFADLLDPERLPALRALVTDPSFAETTGGDDHDDGEDADFDYGLRTVLDGIARRIDG